MWLFACVSRRAYAKDIVFDPFLFSMLDSTAAIFVHLPDWKRTAVTVVPKKQFFDLQVFSDSIEQRVFSCQVCRIVSSPRCKGHSSLLVACFFLIKYFLLRSWSLDSGHFSFYPVILIHTAMPSAAFLIVRHLVQAIGASASWYSVVFRLAHILRKKSDNNNDNYRYYIQSNWPPKSDNIC